MIVPAREMEHIVVVTRLSVPGFRCRISGFVSQGLRLLGSIRMLFRLYSIFNPKSARQGWLKWSTSESDREIQ